MKSLKDFSLFSLKENKASLKVADRFLIAEYYDLPGVFHRSKTTPLQFFSKQIHPGKAFNITHLAADDFAALNGF